MSKYKESGVDIAKGDALVKDIKALAHDSHSHHRIPVSIGGFAAAYQLPKDCGEDPVLLSCVDGVGTKILLAREDKRWGGIGQDVVAMCLNDLACHGGRPLFFLDYLAADKLDLGVARHIVSGIAGACLKCGCALIGGETAELPGMFTPGGTDVAGFALGLVQKNEMWGATRVCEGDVVLGLASSGLHANGFSLVRNILKENAINTRDPLPRDLKITGQWQTWGELLLEPTMLYGPLLQQWQGAQDGIHAAAHITGGGLVDNLARVLPDSCQARIKLASWQQPSLYTWLAKHGDVSRDEAFSVWNMGIGFVLVVAPEMRDTILKHAATHAVGAWDIGVIEARCDTPVVLE